MSINEEERAAEVEQDIAELTELETDLRKMFTDAKEEANKTAAGARYTRDFANVAANVARALVDTKREKRALREEQATQKNTVPLGGIPGS